MSERPGRVEAAGTLDRENPWPGLDAFEEQAHDYFHGREAEAQLLLRRVAAAPLLVLFGKSGLGKTSLLKAGLFPRLRQAHFLPVYIRLDIRPEAPPGVNQILDALRACIEREGVDGPDLAGGETLWEYLHRAGLELWSGQNQLLTPVLVLDQFEEVFTLGERVPGEVERLLVDLGDLAENRIPRDLAASLQADEAAAGRLDLQGMRYKLLISLREDFLPELEAWQRVVPSLGRARMRLLRMRPDQALAAVYGPATHLMDEALAQRIVQFIARAQTADGPEAPAAASRGRDDGGGEIEPALLSLFCRGLNERRKREGQARFDAQLLEGAQQSIIAEYYRSCLDGMPTSVSRFIENELITERGFRNSHARDDAVPSQMTPEQLERLINRRLLRLEERYGTQRIELTHDLLTAAVRSDRDRRRAEEDRAAQAQRAEEERRALAEQARLREERLEAERRAERELRLEAEARAGKRFKRLAAVLAAALAVAVGASTVAYWLFLEAHEQRQVAMVEANRAGQARRDAEAQRQLAEQRLVRITEGIRMKQAVLSGDRERISAFLTSEMLNRDIRFAARARDLGYRNQQNQPVYQFSLFPVARSLPTGHAAVAVITYRMDHPTFQNALLATGPDRNFTASYTGWGCLQQVVALIEYVNPDRAPEIAAFDMCATIQW